MRPRLNRRRLLLATGALAAALAMPPPPTTDAASPSLTAADLVEDGAAFRRGAMAGVALVGGDGADALVPSGDAGVFTSAVLTSPMPFTHVGLHWLETQHAAGQCALELRTSADGAIWSPWRAVQAECLPAETPTGEFFAPLRSAPGHRLVQYRASLHGDRGRTPRLERVTATVIASQPQPPATMLRTVPVVDQESGLTLQVTPRELWLADETLRFRDGGTKIWPEMFVPAQKLVVHHTETRNDYATLDEAAAEVRAIYYYHAVTREWGDIGYSALVDRFGNLYEGRHGRGEGVSREVLSAGVVAGHDLSHNYGSAGVALVGDATAPDWPMPAAAGPMWDALVRYSVFEAGRSFVPPLARGGEGAKGGPVPATSDFLRSDDRWSDAMRNVSGHRETNDTTCPGDAVMALLEDLRVAIDAGLSDRSRIGVLVAAEGRQATVGRELFFRCMLEPPEEGWRLVGYDYRLEGWVRLPESEDIEYLDGFTAGTQPYPEWTRLETSVPAIDVTYTPAVPGHYTLAVRAVLQWGMSKAAIQRSSAYAGRHTYLITAADGIDR